ncbi:MAG: DnaB-like helicase N-terminal domain-containing protein, partial [Eubacterium sp.]|nr:DnaB-like helicase N-terminal domain-containing protein [Eubacterium sp.]
MPEQEAILKRIMPHSEEAEQGVIGSMLMRPEAIETASEMLTGEDFYQKQYGVIFDSMLELHNEGKAVDIITLQERLREKKVPPEISEFSYVRSLLNMVPSSLNVEGYCKIVKDKSRLRTLISLAAKAQNRCYEEQETTDRIMEDSEAELFKFFQTGNSVDSESISDIVVRVLENIEKAAHTDGKVTGLATGFTDLDYKTSGFQKSDLILVAARPSMGKTAFVLNIAEYMAFRKQKSVAIFSLEMSRDQLVNRLIAMEG